MAYRAEPKIVHAPMFRANTWLLVLRMQRQKLWPLKNIISCSHSPRRVLIPCLRFLGNSFIRKSTTRYKSSIQTKRQYLNGTKVDSVLHQGGRRRAGDNPPLPNKERRTPSYTFLGYNDLYDSNFGNQKLQQTSCMVTIGVGERRRLVVCRLCVFEEKLRAQ